MSHDISHLLGLGEDELLKELLTLPSPVELSKLTSKSSDLVDRIKTPSMAMKLLSHFFGAPLGVLEQTYGTLHFLAKLPTSTEG